MALQNQNPEDQNLERDIKQVPSQLDNQQRGKPNPKEVLKNTTEDRASLKRNVFRKTLIAGDTGATPDSGEEDLKKDRPELTKLTNALQKKFPWSTFTFWNNKKYDIKKFKENQKVITEGIQKAQKRFYKNERAKIFKVGFVIVPDSNTGVINGTDGRQYIAISYLQTAEEIEATILDALKNEYGQVPPVESEEIETTKLDDLMSDKKLEIDFAYEDSETYEITKGELIFTKDPAKEGDKAVIYSSNVKGLYIFVPTYAPDLAIIKNERADNTIDIYQIDLNARYVEDEIAAGLSKTYPYYLKSKGKEALSIPQIYFLNFTNKVPVLEAAISKIKKTSPEAILTFGENVNFYINIVSKQITIRDTNLTKKDPAFTRRLLNYIEYIEKAINADPQNSVTIENSEIDNSVIKEMTAAKKIVLINSKIVGSDALKTLGEKEGASLILEGCGYDKENLHLLTDGNTLIRIKISNDTNPDLPDSLFTNGCSSLQTLEFEYCSGLTSINSLDPSLLPALSKLSLKGCRNLSYENGIRDFIEKDWESPFILNITDTGINEFDAIVIRDALKAKDKNNKVVYEFSNQETEKEVHIEDLNIRTLSEEDAAFIEKQKPKSVIEIEDPNSAEPGTKTKIPVYIEGMPKVEGVNKYDIKLQEEIREKAPIIQKALASIMGDNTDIKDELKATKIFIQGTGPTFGFKGENGTNYLIIGEIYDDTSMRQAILEAIGKSSEKADDILGDERRDLDEQLTQLAGYYGFHMCFRHSKHDDSYSTLEEQGIRDTEMSENLYTHENIKYLRSDFIRNFKKIANEIGAEKEVWSYIGIVLGGANNKPGEWEANKDYLIDTDDGTTLNIDINDRNWISLKSRLIRLLASEKHDLANFRLDSRNPSLHIKLIAPTDPEIYKSKDFNLGIVNKFAGAIHSAESELAKISYEGISASDYKITLVAPGTELKREGNNISMSYDISETEIKQLILAELKEDNLEPQKDKPLQERLDSLKSPFKSLTYTKQALNNAGNWTAPTKNVESFILENITYVDNIRRAAEEIGAGEFSYINIILYPDENGTRRREDELSERKIYLPIPISSYNASWHLKSALALIQKTDIPHLPESTTEMSDDELFVTTHDDFGNKVTLRKTAAIKFNEARKIAAKKGYMLYVGSSYRTYEDQVSIYKNGLHKHGISYSYTKQLSSDIKDKSKMAALIESWRNDPLLAEKMEAARPWVANPYGEYPPHLSGGTVDVYAVPLQNVVDARWSADKAMEIGGYLEHQEALNKIMREAGFKRYNKSYDKDGDGPAEEWWHFEYGTHQWQLRAGPDQKKGMPADFKEFKIAETRPENIYSLELTIGLLTEAEKIVKEVEAYTKQQEEEKKKQDATNEKIADLTKYSLFGGNVVISKTATLHTGLLSKNIEMKAFDMPTTNKGPANSKIIKTYFLVDKEKKTNPSYCVGILSENPNFIYVYEMNTAKSMMGQPFALEKPLYKIPLSPETDIQKELESVFSHSDGEVEFKQPEFVTFDSDKAVNELDEKTKEYLLLEVIQKGTPLSPATPFTTEMAKFIVKNTTGDSTIRINCPLSAETAKILAELNCNLKLNGNIALSNPRTIEALSTFKGNLTIYSPHLATLQILKNFHWHWLTIIDPPETSIDYMKALSKIESVSLTIEFTTPTTINPLAIPEIKNFKTSHDLAITNLMVDQKLAQALLYWKKTHKERGLRIEISHEMIDIDEETAKTLAEARDLKGKGPFRLLAQEPIYNKIDKYRQQQKQ